VPCSVPGTRTVGTVKVSRGKLPHGAFPPEPPENRLTY
jgi:hypothetical protein